MKLTGYQIREALRRAVANKTILEKQFGQSLWAFPKENKSDPRKLGIELQEADNAVASLQCLQQKYNDTVQVKVGDRHYTLALAVKKIGGASRLATLWKNAAIEDGSKDRYSGRKLSRDKDEIQAVRQVSQDEARQLAQSASSEAGLIRAAIAIGNSEEIDFQNIEPDLFA